MIEAKLFGLCDTTVWRDNATNFPAETNLAKYNNLVVQLTASRSTSNSHTNCQIRSGIIKAHTADHVNEDIFILEAELRAFF